MREREIEEKKSKLLTLKIEIEISIKKNNETNYIQWLKNKVTDKLFRFLCKSKFCFIHDYNTKITTHHGFELEYGHCYF